MTEASRLGMDVSEAEFEVQEATSKLTQTRSYIHSFSLEQLEPIATEGIQRAQKAEAHGQQAIGEFRFRRHGLWITLVIIGLLVGGLYLKIHDIERPK